jgi:glycosyltransferase involved in cell wall biosynthesis
MACLIRSSDSKKKGVVSFTTQEVRFLVKNPIYRKKFDTLKTRYHVGLHFNWHDFHYRPALNWDFLLAGKDDLIDLHGERVETLNLDACNFSPACMAPGNVEKHWDVLYVARAVFFKGIEDFFASIRSLYDSGRRFRVLFVCPAPPDSKTQTEALVSMYEKMFSLEDRRFFNFLVLRENYPFFFDLPTLAHFYRSSRVFVHTAPDERRCRVAAYAFCTGLPVVGMEPVGSILSQAAQEKVFFKVHSREDFKARILDALNAVTRMSAEDFTPARKELSEVFSVEVLRDRLCAKLGEDSAFLDGKWHLRQLDIRMGRHHGFGKGPNSLSYNLGAFMDLLLESEVRMGVGEDVEFEASGLCGHSKNELPVSQEAADRVEGILRSCVGGIRKTARKIQGKQK